MSGWKMSCYESRGMRITVRSSASFLPDRWAKLANYGELHRTLINFYHLRKVGVYLKTIKQDAFNQRLTIQRQEEIETRVRVISFLFAIR